MGNNEQPCIIPTHNKIGNITHIIALKSTLKKSKKKKKDLLDNIICILESIKKYV